jgi:predicted RNase H-like HicB family nuclease
MKIEVIIEKGNKEFWGRVEGYDFLPVTSGKTITNVLENLKMLIEDYIAHEGKSDKAWKNILVNEIDFSVSIVD